MSIFEELDSIYQEEEYKRLKDSFLKKSVDDIIRDGYSKELAESIYNTNLGREVENVSLKKLFMEIEECLR